jgi:threonine dehydratase
VLPTYQDVVAARGRIAGGVYYSPCPQSLHLSELCGFTIYCKQDYLQSTGSFKERGARNALLLLEESRRKRGVVAASAGNHALGLAYHGRLLGIPVSVVMPEFAPLIKVSTCQRFGARVILHGHTFGEAKQRADEMAAAEGLTYIHGYDDPAIIAGQGTMGLEILEQVPQADAVVVPIGGGGLIAGVALAIKEQRPAIELIGVEPEGAACYSAALAAGHPVDIACRATLADGLAVTRAGENAFAIARRHVDRVVTVNEDQIALAILRLVEMEKGVVEGAGATPLAAALSGQLDHLKGKSVVLALCGGNIDPAILSRVIEKGLVADGRIGKFTAVISDRPGGLARFAALVASTGASIKEVLHDRAFSGPDVSAVQVLCIIETRDRAHLAEVYRRLRADDVEVVEHESG